MTFLVVAGTVIILVIGYRSASRQIAIMSGALFAVIAIMSNSPIINGYTGHGDPMVTSFFPYLLYAAVAGVAGGAIALLGSLVRYRH